MNIPAYGQNITGPWSGALEVQGTQLRLVFNITKTDSGYRSTMDSPDQGAKDIPVPYTSFVNSVLKMEIPKGKIEYTGALNKENVFIGEFKQSGQTFPLNLSKGVMEAKKAIRPQDPLKPYPYYSEEIQFENLKDNIALAGTLTLPSKEGIYPVVVLITGSGPQNRDEELLGHKPFLVLSDYLTRKGIGVLRFDDRGVALSKGNFESATTLDFAADVESAVAYLETRKEIKKSKIGLIGHSEGGIIAPIVAAKMKDVSFIVLLAGTGIPGDQLLLLQTELIERVSGTPEDEVKRGLAVNKGAFELIKKSNNTDQLKTDIQAYMKQKLKEDPGINPEKMNDSIFIKMVADGLMEPWMQFFIKYDPYAVLKDVKCPVLALDGDKDLQVPSKINLEAIKKGLEAGGNKKVTTKEFRNVNHLFQECKTGSPEEYAKIEQTMSPVVLKEISDWILIQVK